MEEEWIFKKYIFIGPAEENMAEHMVREEPPERARTDMVVSEQSEKRERGMEGDRSDQKEWRTTGCGYTTHIRTEKRQLGMLWIRQIEIWKRRYTESSPSIVERR